MKDTNTDENRGEQKVLATRAEVEAAIRALSSAEKKKLMVAATYWWKKFRLQKTEVSFEDLFQEALLRVLKDEDARHWPKATVSFVKFLDRTMESIASHHRERLNTERKTAKNSRPLESFPPSEGVSAPQPNKTSNVEDQLVAREEIEALRSYFGKDEQGFQAVYLRALGLDASEMQEELGISETEWETVRKRVQRKFAKYIGKNEEET